MFKTLANAFKNKEVRTKLLFTLLILFIYRVGCWIPTPGVSTDLITQGVGQTNSFLVLLNGISGNALGNGAFLALGISPYINASIIAQLLTVAIPALERWSKQGDEGKRKMAVFTRVLTVILAIVQAIGVVISLNTMGYISTNIYSVEMPVWVVCMLVSIVLIAGAVFTMWLGEKLTDLGIGNGISLMIFVGILASAGISLLQNITAWFEGGDRSAQAPWQFVTFFLIIAVVFGFMVFIDGAERKIPVQYAKQIKGRKQYGGQNTHIPIKINASGVLPIIFATAIISFPQLIMQLCNVSGDNWWYQYFSPTGTLPWGYYVLAGLLILFFSYFYSLIQFRPDEVARNLQQYGGFIPGIRPGKATGEYLKRVNRRLTLFGAIYLVLVFVVPGLILTWVNNLAFPALKDIGLTSAFSSTGMLIVVSVALDFQKQLESQLMMRQYRGFLK